MHKRLVIDIIFESKTLTLLIRTRPKEYAENQLFLGISNYNGFPFPYGITALIAPMVTEMENHLTRSIYFMKKAFLVTFFLGTLLLLAGCAQATPEEKFLSHWEKIVGIMSADRNDPAQALAEVKTYLDSNLAEMKTLAGEFGKEESKKLAENPDFIDRVMKLANTINDLAKTNKSLVDDPRFADAYSSLSTLYK